MAVGATVTMTGAVGSLRWFYHEAASVANWTVARTDDGGWGLSGTVQQANTFWLSQRPLVFVVPRAKGAWRFQIITLQIEGARLAATLGPIGA